MKDDPLFRELPDSFDERVPPPPAPEPPVRRWDVALTTLLGLCLTAAIVMGIAPKFGEVFRQVKLPMPSLTLTLLRLSDLAIGHPVLAALLITGIPASVHLWNARAVSIGRVLIPILNFITWGWMVVALFLPLTCLLEGMGSRR